MASESVGEVTGIMVIIHFVEPNEDDVNYLEMVYPWEIEISECIGAAACTFYPAGLVFSLRQIISRWLELLHRHGCGQPRTT